MPIPVKTNLRIHLSTRLKNTRNQTSPRHIAEAYHHIIGVHKRHTALYNCRLPFATAGPPFATVRPPFITVGPPTADLHFTQCRSLTVGPNFTQCRSSTAGPHLQCRCPSFGGIEERCMSKVKVREGSLGIF
ncbi:hypothetical protein AMTRI_Chr01g109620 [Amborella trichopoda]